MSGKMEMEPDTEEDVLSVLESWLKGLGSKLIYLEERYKRWLPSLYAQVLDATQRDEVDTAYKNLMGKYDELLGYLERGEVDSEWHKKVQNQIDEFEKLARRYNIF